MAKLTIEFKPSQEEIDDEPIAFWRFSIARHGLIEALRLASSLMSQAETGDRLDEYEQHHTTAELVAVLAAAIQKSTEP